MLNEAHVIGIAKACTVALKRRQSKKEKKNTHRR